MIILYYDIFTVFEDRDAELQYTKMMVCGWAMLGYSVIYYNSWYYIVMM